MSLKNVLWGAPRIHGELLKLGVNVCQTTVAKYMIRRVGPPVPRKKSILICGVRQPRILNTNIYAFGLKSIDVALPTAARECSMIRFLPSTASKRNILSS